jgi:hypothetical protein
LRRLVTLTVVSTLGLTLCGTASAAYNPSLLVGETSPALGRNGSVRIFIRTSPEDDQTAIATVYAPSGYRLELGQRSGAELGTVIAFLGAEAVQGSIRSDDPAAHASNQCAPGRHDAVWRIDLTLAGHEYRLPVYVDRVVAGPEAAYASARMRMCLGSLPLRYADITVGNVFTNPDRQGTYAWNAVFVPYSPGTAMPNYPLAAQSTSYVGLPAAFAVSARLRQRGKQRVAVVTACLREAGQAVPGVRVTLYYGGRSVFASRKVAVRRTGPGGCMKARVRIRKLMIVFASVHVPVRQGAGCTPSLAPRCSASSIYPPSERFKPVKIVR